MSYTLVGRIARRAYSTRPKRGSGCFLSKPVFRCRRGVRPSAGIMRRLQTGEAGKRGLTKQSQLGLAKELPYNELVHFRRFPAIDQSQLAGEPYPSHPGSVLDARFLDSSPIAGLRLAGRPLV